MTYSSDFGNICAIERTRKGNYYVTLECDGFNRKLFAGNGARNCRAWIKFHFGGV